MIHFEDSEASGNWTWHYGSYEKGDKQYDFTVLEMSPGAYELTWVDETPDDAEVVENVVEEKFG
jgi:hypothetical protein